MERLRQRPLLCTLLAMALFGGALAVAGRLRSSDGIDETLVGLITGVVLGLVVGVGNWVRLRRSAIGPTR